MSKQDDDFDSALNLLWLAYCALDDISPVKRRIFDFMHEQAPDFIAGFHPDQIETPETSPPHVKR